MIELNFLLQEVDTNLKCCFWFLNITSMFHLLAYVIMISSLDRLKSVHNKHKVLLLLFLSRTNKSLTFKGFGAYSVGLVSTMHQP